MGGNMLLNIGPDEHGVIPEKQVELLEGLGGWIATYEEAVYPVQTGLTPRLCLSLHFFNR